MSNILKLKDLINKFDKGLSVKREIKDDIINILESLKDLSNVSYICDKLKSTRLSSENRKYISLELKEIIKNMENNNIDNNNINMDNNDILQKLLYKFEKGDYVSRETKDSLIGTLEYYDDVNDIIKLLKGLKLSKENREYVLSRLKGIIKNDNLYIISIKENIKENKYKKKQIPKIVRDDVWKKYCGKKYSGDCFCCGKEIEHDYYECGHVISERNGGETTIENLRPLCSPCNKSIGKKNMEEFMKEYGYKKSENWYGYEYSFNDQNLRNKNL